MHDTENKQRLGYSALGLIILLAVILASVQIHRNNKPVIAGEVAGAFVGTRDFEIFGQTYTAPETFTSRAEVFKWLDEGEALKTSHVYWTQRFMVIVARACSGLDCSTVFIYKEKGPQFPRHWQLTNILQVENIGTLSAVLPVDGKQLAFIDDGCNTLLIAKCYQ